MPFTTATSQKTKLTYIDQSTGLTEVREGGSKSWRNNNPGNLRYGDYAQKQGAIGKDYSNFAIFPDEATGKKAQKNLILGPSYKNGDMTINDFLHKYAPPNENDTEGYKKFIGNKLQVDPNTTKVKDLNINDLLDSMKQKEGWKPGKVTETKPIAHNSGHVIDNNGTSTTDQNLKTNPQKQTSNLEPQPEYYRDKYEKLSTEIQQNPAFADASSREVDLGVALSVLKENEQSQNGQSSEQANTEVAGVLSQSDQVRQWKESLEPADYREQSTAYIEDIHNDAQEIYQEHLNPSQQQVLG